MEKPTETTPMESDIAADNLENVIEVELTADSNKTKITDDEMTEVSKSLDSDEIDDDESDDNIKVVIKAIKRSASEPKINLYRYGVDDRTKVADVPSELSVDSLLEKPWRKPGADITDYFNFGFNEDTWRAYCERQKRMRFFESTGGVNQPIAAENKMGGTSHGLLQTPPSYLKKEPKDTAKDILHPIQVMTSEVRGLPRFPKPTVDVAAASDRFTPSLDPVVNSSYPEFCNPAARNDCPPMYQFRLPSPTGSWIHSSPMESQGHPLSPQSGYGSMNSSLARPGPMFGYGPQQFNPPSMFKLPCNQFYRPMVPAMGASIKFAPMQVMPRNHNAARMMEPSMNGRIAMPPPFPTEYRHSNQPQAVERFNRSEMRRGDHDDRWRTDWNRENGSPYRETRARSRDHSKRRSESSQRHSSRVPMRERDRNSERFQHREERKKMLRQSKRSDNSRGSAERQHRRRSSRHK